MASKKQPLSMIKAIRDAQPLVVTEAICEAVAGGAVARSLAEVGAAFGVKESTIKCGWRQNGMPGRSGVYRLADVLFWRLSRDAKGYSDGPADEEDDCEAAVMERLEALEESISDRLTLFERSIKRIVENAIADSKI